MMCVCMLLRSANLFCGVCAPQINAKGIFVSLCGYLCIVMLHAVEKQISVLLMDGILDSVTAGSVFPGGQAFAGGHGPWRIGFHWKMQ